MDTPANTIGELSLLQRRILGVLIEKSRTTPDAYPLTLNSLTTGCNQKSNRDPVMEVDEGQVEECAETLMKRGFISLIQAGRTDRYRHLIYEAWNVNKMEAAILAELMLRGPQTEGELRTRASRMENIDTLETLRESLEMLGQRQLVQYLTPPKSRGAIVTHGFHPSSELQRFKSDSKYAVTAEDLVTSTPPKVHLDEMPQIKIRLEHLETEVQQLRMLVENLQEKLKGVLD